MRIESSKMTQSQSSKENEGKSGYVPNEATASTFTNPFQNLMSRSSTSSPMFNVACSKDGSYDEDANDQPVDYSKKYTERNSLRQNMCFHNVEVDQSSKKEFCNRDTKVDLFGDYAETDLDQPTDYSLRYAEDDTDEDEKENSRYFPGSEQEDTVKTYCTEGTPYETPFNFSTATSMSDLRVDDSKEGDVLRKAPEKTINVKVKEDGQFKSETEQQHCDRCETLMNKDLKDQKNTSVLSSGLMSPEKPVNYCEEGTPSCFSRINSLSSLGSVLPTRNIVDTDIMLEASSADNNGVIRAKSSSQDVRTFEDDKPIVEETDTLLEVKNDVRVVDKEGKMVTFGGEDHYAEETPLMFSRCSSLGSLSGFEQHSIHDDRSSVVSDFSHRTSGVVSPSELPDSPTQTVPPSPRHHKIPPIDFTSMPQEETTRPPARHLSHDKFHPTKCSVFEDDIAAFKEESTPIQFSAATSLSSLTIDDEPKIIIDSKLDDTTERTTACILAETERESSTIVDVTNVVETEADHDQVSDGDEDDEDILAACINMGMQNNRYRQSFKRNSFQKISHPQSTTNLARYQTSSALNRLGANISTVSEKPTSLLRKSKTNVEVVAIPDTVHIYCTENTPADISPAGSQSNLSVLSMLSAPEDFEKIEQRRSLEINDQRNELSDDSSSLSGDDEKILNECIQSGIPKVRQTTPPSITCISVAKKSEVLSQTFDTCSTPSSSLVQSAHSDKNVYCKSLPCTFVEDKNDISDNNSMSDDDAILTECIQSAMPKARLNTPPFPRPTSASKKVEMQYDKSNLCAGSSSPAPLQQVLREQVSILATVKSELSSENNSSLSEEEEDIMLAQCILSGIPRALNVSSSISSLPVTTKSELHLQRMNYCGTLSSFLVDPVKHAIVQKQLLAANDEAAGFATTDDTAYNFSIVSGIGNLFISPRKNCTEPDTFSTNASEHVADASVSKPDKIKIEDQKDAEGLVEENCSVCSYNSYVFKT